MARIVVVALVDIAAERRTFVLAAGRPAVVIVDRQLFATVELESTVVVEWLDQAFAWVVVAVVATTT